MTALPDISSHASARARWRPAEIVFWILALACAFLFPSRYLIMTDIVRLALFALSLDLILGYAGIVSLGHAAYFGFGSYTAGLIAKWGWGEPLTGLVIAAAAAGVLGYLTSFIIARFRHLALIMITLGLGLLLAEAANSASWLTGGADGLQGVRMWKLLGMFQFDLYGTHRLQPIRWWCCSWSFWWRDGSSTRRSAWHCAEFVRMRSACLRSERRAPRIFARSTPSPRSWPAPPALFLRKRQRQCRSRR